MTIQGLGSAPESQIAETGTTKVALEHLKAEFQNKSPDIVKKMKEAKNMLKSPDKLNFKDYEGKFKQSQADINSLGDKLNAENAKVKDSSNTELSSLLQELSNEHKLLVATFKGLDKPENFKKDKEEIREITNGPRVAFMDKSLSIDVIKGIKVEDYVAKHGTIKYYVVDVAGEKQVLRIETDDKKSGHEVAILDINDISETDPEEKKEKIISRIDTAEITTSGNAFHDVEVDGMNIYNSGLDALGEGILPGLGAGAGAAVAAKAVAGYVATKTTATATTAGVWGFCKIVATGVGSSIGIGTGVAVAGTALLAGGVVATFTDVDLTAKRARDFGLYKKLENIESQYS